jgi:hypothetical protein
MPTAINVKNELKFMKDLEKSNKKNKLKNIPNYYISYFQSVTTIGVISLAKNPKEAKIDATKRMKDSAFAHGVVGQTPMTFAMTEKWEG